MKFENIRVYNFEHALRGMRNPKESYHLSDSEFGIDFYKDIELKIKNKYIYDDLALAAYKDHILYSNGNFAEYAFIGENDMKLAKNLIRGGSEHRKFLRQIFVSVDITAPLYWWKEFDTYKVGTVANSTSTMHTIHKTPITIDNFEIDDYDPSLGLIDPIHIGERVDCFINDLEQLRQTYMLYNKKAKETTDLEERARLVGIAKKYWKELIRWTPDSWLQTRTVTMNYENLLGMCSRGQRRFHKLNEWSGIDDEYLTNFINFARQLPYAQDLIFIDEE
jgi:hypothetical protein